jgi:ABC-2 type transport system permease protein
MSEATLAVRQLRFTNRAFWRNPASAFFTFAFPLMFLVIFTSLLGGDQLTFGPPDGPGELEIKQSTYYVVAIMVFGIISACYTNVAISTTFSRDAGVLKRTKGTPLPGRVYLSARVMHATFIGILLVVITAAFGAIVYDAGLPAGVPLLEFLVILIVGSLSFSALALALTAAIPNADASPAIVNASILPLLFLSGVFIPFDNDTPQWIETLGGIFPVKPFLDAMIGGYLGNVTAPTPARPFRVFPFAWTDVLVVAAWGLAGLVLATRFFSWEPRK